MFSLGVARSTAALPQAYRSDKLRFHFSVVLRRIYARLVSLLLATAAFIIAAVMFIMATGIHVPEPWTFSKVPATFAAKQVTASPKPKLVGAPAVTSSTCSGLQTENIRLFDTCPSLYLDYSTQRSGSVSTNTFNYYTGKPVVNHEAQLYTNSHGNLRIENGSLVLEALKDPQQGFKYTSARIDTQGKEDFLYGMLVVRATIPTGIGTWPAIWMLPSQPKYASLSPATDTTRYLNDGEIDIMEAVGTQPHVVYGIAHSLAYPEDGVNRAYFNTITLPDNDTTFHDYEVDWTPTNLTFRVDGKPYFSYSKKPGANYRSWPYDQPFYLVMNLALGGTWGGTDKAQFPTDGVDGSSLPAALKIQSVRYYSYTGPQ